MFGHRFGRAQRCLLYFMGVMVALSALAGPLQTVRAAPQQVAAPTAGCSLSFDDVAADNPFYGFIGKLVCADIVAGYEDRTFKPAAEVTRGQLAKFVSNAAGYSDEIPIRRQSFSDVPTDNPFWLFVERVRLHGVVGGYADGTFRPFASVTRGQTAKFVANAAGYADDIPAARRSFSDVPASNPFWLFVERVRLHGVVGGYSDGSFKPANSVTRGQTAKFIANALLAPSAQELIAAARAAGTIDYGTSLLYRAYALFGDTRLPIEYLGAGSVGEDLMLISEINAPDEPVAPAVQAQLRPYGLRPDEAGSIYSIDSGSAAKSAAPAPRKDKADAIGCGRNGWASKAAAHRARLWARCNRPADANYEDHINSTITVIDKIWQPLSDLMGPPIQDAGGPSGGGDTAIDIYLLDIGQPDPRGHSVAGPANGYSVPVAPINRAKSSGYIAISNTRVNEPQLHSTLIHEFFHVLQFAHNFKLYSKPGDHANFFWFSEASATWAASFYDRTLNWSARGADVEVYPRFTNAFQHDNLSLHTSAPSHHLYDAFIYPYFMVQENIPDIIAKAWRAFEGLGAGDWDGALRKLDALYPFADHFADFTLRNLNSTFDNQNPLGTRYHDFDELFPDNKKPHFAANNRLGVWPVSAPPLKIPAQVRALSATYYHFVLDAGVKQVKLDFSHIEASNALSSNPLRIRAVYKKSDGAWETRALPNHSEATICNISELYLVLTDIDFDQNTLLAGHFDVRALAAPCECDSAFLVRSGWNGSIGVNWQVSAVGTRNGAGIQRGNVSHTANVIVAWRQLVGGANPATITWQGRATDGSVGGTGRIDDTFDYTNGAVSDHSSLRGSGPLHQLSMASLTMHSDSCSYDVEGFIFLPVRDENNNEDIMTVGLFKAANQQLPDSADAGQTLFGSSTIAVTLVGGAPGNASYFGGGASDAQNAVLDLRGNLGNATVNWEFAPAP